MSVKWWQLLLLLFQLLRLTLASGDYYTAGVVEFRPALSGGSSEQLLADNLAAYLELIESANGTADIIVFPEGTLNSQLQLTAVPAPSKRSLCHIAFAAGDDPVANFLRQLACAAVAARSYLVLNVKERESCSNASDCPARGHRLFNTNLVLDRAGALISRYRKWNLYLEPQLNRTAQPEYGIFHTDFNVTFGHFVCFDMLFYTPAQELVERLQLRHLIVTKMFKSELPFLTASGLQQGWAWANNVNLLAAGASLPHGGISGSGIYAARGGALVRRMVGDADVGERQLLLAQVPRTPPGMGEGQVADVERAGPAQLPLAMLQQPQLRDFSSWQLPLHVAGVQRRRLCHTDLCCDFEVQLTTSPALGGHSYRLGVFVGRRRYEEAQFSAVRLCGLFACRNSSVASCGLLPHANGAAAGTATATGTEFSWLRVSGRFVRRQRQLLMPSTLSAALYALQPSELHWQQQQQQQQQPQQQHQGAEPETTLVQMELRKPHAQLLTFAIYGNYFDDPTAGSGSGSGSGNSLASAAAAAAVAAAAAAVAVAVLSGS